jgi:hypothetical protein
MELIGTHFSSLRWYWTWGGWALAQDVITVLTLLQIKLIKACNWRITT